MSDSLYRASPAQCSPSVETRGRIQYTSAPIHMVSFHPQYSRASMYNVFMCLYICLCLYACLRVYSIFHYRYQICLLFVCVCIQYSITDIKFVCVHTYLTDLARRWRLGVALFVVCLWLITAFCAICTPPPRDTSANKHTRSMRTGRPGSKYSYLHRCGYVAIGNRLVREALGQYISVQQSEFCTGGQISLRGLFWR